MGGGWLNVVKPQRFQAEAPRSLCPQPRRSPFSNRVQDTFGLLGSYMMRCQLLAVTALVGLLPALGVKPAAAEPLALHPANPHYFLWRGEPTILVTSGEHYGAVLNLDFDYRRYLDELQHCGLNHTRTFVGVYREIPNSFGITDNPLAPKPGRYVCPWARSDQPGYFDGGNRFDLTTWDPAYFARLQDFLQQANQRGVVVEVNLFCPFYNDELWMASPMNVRNNVNGIGDCGREQVYTLQHADLLQIQLEVTRKIVQESKDFDNLYYEVCNEPYFGGVTRDWQHRIVDTIAEVESQFAGQHLISLNIANGRQQVENPHPRVSIFNFHYCTPPDTVAMNYGLNKVIGENETGFRGQQDLIYRTEGWDFLLAGGGLYNNLDYSFTPTHADGSLQQYRSPGGGSRALRQQLRVLKEFLQGFDFVRMRPDSSVIQQISDELVASALSDPGQAYAIYLHVPIPPKPEKLAALRRQNLRALLTLNLPAATYRGEWIHTQTGEQIQVEHWNHEGGSLRLQTPPFDDDLALRLRRQQP